MRAAIGERGAKEGEAQLSWIEEKAYTELARIREARENQVYPYYRKFESGGLHTTIGGKPLVNFS
jgi:hypothetical protein